MGYEVGFLHVVLQIYSTISSGYGQYAQSDSTRLNQRSPQASNRETKIRYLFESFLYENLNRKERQLCRVQSCKEAETTFKAFLDRNGTKYSRMDLVNFFKGFLS